MIWPWITLCARAIKAPFSLEVGGELAVALTVDGGNLTKTWANDWDKKTEFHSRPKVKELLQTRDGIVQRSTQGMKGGAKGSPKGAGQ